MVFESTRRFLLAVVVMMIVSNSLRVSIDAASHALAQQQRLQLQRTTLVLTTTRKLVQYADVACTSAGCLARTVNFLRVDQTRRSAADPRRHAPPGSRPAVVYDPSLRCARVRKLRSRALTNQTMLIHLGRCIGNGTLIPR